MKYLYTPIEMAKLKWLTTASVGEDVEQLELSNPVGENVKLYKNFRKRSGIYALASFFLTSIYYSIEYAIAYLFPSRNLRCLNFFTIKNYSPKNLGQITYKKTNFKKYYVSMLDSPHSSQHWILSIFFIFVSLMGEKCFAFSWELLRLRVS